MMQYERPKYMLHTKNCRKYQVHRFVCKNEIQKCYIITCSNEKTQKAKTHSLTVDDLWWLSFNCYHPTKFGLSFRLACFDLDSDSLLGCAQIQNWTLVQVQTQNHLGQRRRLRFRLGLGLGLDLDTGSGFGLILRLEFGLGFDWAKTKIQI